MLAHIVAASENNVIGRDNQLPWHIPEDMKWFRERTKGRALIMGRKTFESLGKPLPHRLNVVVTRQKNFAAQLTSYPEHSPVVVCETIENAIAYCQQVAGQYQDEVFIIGGGDIYRQSMKLVDVIFLTRVHAQIEGTVHYPEVPMDQFDLVSERVGQGQPGYTFLEYRRKARNKT